MRKIAVVVIMLSLAFSPIFFQGALAGEASDYGKLDGTLIFSTDKVITDISVYGNRAAWTVWNGDGGENGDVYAYSGNSVSQLTSSPYVERHSSVGELIAWEKWMENSSAIESTAGTIYSGPLVSSPHVDGKNVVFLSEDGVMLYSHNNVKKISNVSDYSPDISGSYVVYGPYIYSLKNSTEWMKFRDLRISSKISYPWIMMVGKNNFGRSTFVDLYNIELDYYTRVWNEDTGSYWSLDSFEIDGNYAVWSYNGIAYVYDLVSMKLTQYSWDGGDIEEISVGGGKLLWSVYEDSGKYAVYMGDAPASQDYVDIILISKNLQHGEYNTLLLTDSQGNHLGYDRDFQHYEDIPGGIEFKSAGDKIVYRVVGNTEGIKYDVLGNSNGKYDLVIRYHSSKSTFGYSADLKSEIVAIDIPINTGELHRYLVNWGKVIGGAKNAIEVLIDKNGDGNFELDIFPSSTHITPAILQGNGSSGSGTTSDDSIFSFDISLEGTTCYAALFILFLIIIGVLLHRRKR